VDPVRPNTKPPSSGFFVARLERAFSFLRPSMRKEKNPPVDKLTQATKVITLITAIAKLAILVYPHLPF
jgi:hypothetical protein